ncbi:MAG TPA: acylphosphatase [Geobacteraceae bacterium]|nr:acylphosphatase [Geobacteraceae bacterium]
MVRQHLLIKGNVQGVSYRKSAKRKAEELRVNGWVRNLPTGEVEACVEGSHSAVTMLADWCRQGPPRSTVEEVVMEQEEFRNEFSQFEIR